MTQQFDDNEKVPTIEPALKSLSQLYTFRRLEEVFSFLHSYPFLVPLLVEAYSKIAEYFEPSPEVVLEVVTDPEVIDDHELFAFIRINLPPDEALNRLDRFDQKWWLDEADRAEGKLCIHVEFR